MKSKRIFLAILMMAIFGWQSAFALEYRNGGLLFTTTTDPANPSANVVTVRLDETNIAAIGAVLNIPSQVEMYAGTNFTVIEIEDGAFAALGNPATNLVHAFTSVTIPATVKKIGDYAFVNTSINTLTILRDATSTLEVGIDAFGGSTMIVKEVKWGGTIKQWCETDFANMGANPITVKDWSASNANYPRLALMNPIQYTNSETVASATAATTSTYTYLVDRPSKNSTNARKVDGVIVAYASTRLILPEDVVTINPYAFANRPFRYIKAFCTAPDIEEGTFNFIQNTYVYVTCANKASFNNHTQWKKAYNRKGNNYLFVEYYPGDIVRNSGKYIYSSINPSEVIATIKYTKPICTGADAGKWTITADCEPGYQFNRWSGGDFNGVTVNPLKGEVDQEMPATAFVDRIIYNVTLSSNNTTMGSIGSNSQLSAYYNENMTLTATANTGYKFVRWSNGHSENPYTITITSDTNLTAYFEKDETIATETVYATNFTDNAYDNNLWRFCNGELISNIWAINAGKLQVSAINSDSASKVVVYRRLTLAAATHYTLKVNGLTGPYSYANDNLAYALIRRTGSNLTDDSLDVAAYSGSWTPIVRTAADITLNVTPLATAGEYFLAFRYTKAANTSASTIAMSGLKFSERKFAVKTVIAPDSADATLAGADSVYANTGVTLTATTGTETDTYKQFGYAFAGWYNNAACTGSPVSTDASYTVPSSLISDDLTFYAKYEPKPVQLTLTASRGVRFLEGNNYTTSSQLLTAPEDAAYTADEDYQGYTTGIYYGSDRTINRPNATTLRGVHDQVITIEAKPVDGYVFKEWSDGNSDNPRTMTLNFVGAASYSGTNTDATATMLSNLKPVFEFRNDYVVTAVVRDSAAHRVDNTMGTVTGAGTYSYNQQVTLTATAKSHYTFVCWVDGNGKKYTTPSITFKVQGDNYGSPANPQTAKGQNEASRQLKAYFEIEKYTVTINPEDLERGNVNFDVDNSNGLTVTSNWIEGEGRTADVIYRGTAIVTATAFSGYRFAGWLKDETDTIKLNTPYVFTPTADIKLTALFEEDNNSIIVTDTIHRDSIVYVPVEIEVPTYVPVPVNIYDTTYNDVYISVPVTVYDTTYESTTINVPVTVYDTTVVPVVSYKDSIVTVPVYINNPVYRDTVIVITTYQPEYRDTTIYRNVYVDVPYYDTISVSIDTTICDTLVIDNYFYDTIFLTTYIHDTIYIHDTVYLEGIDDVETLNLKLYQRNGRVVVSGAEGADVSLYDAVGRLLSTKRDNYNELEFEVPASGAYLIRVGDRHTRRIVVVR